MRDERAAQRSHNITGDLTSSMCGVYEDSRSEISGVGQRKCNSLHSINSLVSKVCHLVGFNVALELSGSTRQSHHNYN